MSLEKYFCAYCGRKGYSPISVASGECRSSPSGSHKVIEGEQRHWSCRYCGRTGYSATSVTSGSCPKGPDGRHELMD